MTSAEEHERKAVQSTAGHRFIRRPLTAIRCWTWLRSTNRRTTAQSALVGSLHSRCNLTNAIACASWCGHWTANWWILSWHSNWSSRSVTSSCEPSLWKYRILAKTSLFMKAFTRILNKHLWIATYSSCCTRFYFRHVRDVRSSYPAMSLP